MKIGSMGGSDIGYAQDYNSKKVTSDSGTGLGSSGRDVGAPGIPQPAAVQGVAGSASGTDINKTKSEGDGQDVVNEDILKKAVDQANKTLAAHDKYIEREIHEITRTVMYKLKDSVTNEVIAEYPPKKIQDMIAKMWEMAGLVVDKKA